MFLVIETILPIDVDLGVFEKTRAQLFDYNIPISADSYKL